MLKTGHALYTTDDFFISKHIRAAEGEENVAIIYTIEEDVFGNKYAVEADPEEAVRLFSRYMVRDVNSIHQPNRSL